MHASYLQAPTSAPTRTRRCPSCPAGRAACRRGPSSARSVARASRRSSSDWPTPRAGIADGVAALPGVEVLNDVVFTQVCIALDDDAATEALSERLWDEGEVLAMTSRWHDRAVVRFSVSNWQTDAAQVRRTVDAVARALAGFADRARPGVGGIRLNGGYD